MSVAVDSIVSNVISDSVTSQNLTTLTVGAGANRALVAILTLQQSAPTGVTVVWDSGGTNQSMTLIGTVSDTQVTAKQYMYGLVAPTSGNKTLRASWTGTSDVTLAAGSFTGVNQTGSTTTFANFTSATGPDATTASANVTSATGNYAIGGWETFAAFDTVSATQWFLDDVATNFSSAASYTTGSTTVTFSETALQVEPYGFAGFDLVAASGSTVKPLANFYKVFV